MSELERDDAVLDQGATPMDLSVPAQVSGQANPNPCMTTSPSATTNQITISSAPTSLAGYQIQPQLNLATYGIQIHNGPVAMPVHSGSAQGLPNSQAQVVPQNIQMTRTGIPLVSTGLGSAPLTFHPRVTPHSAFPTALPITAAMQLTLQRLPSSKGQPITVQQIPSGTIVPFVSQQLVTATKVARPGKSTVRHNINTSKNTVLHNSSQKILASTVNVPLRQRMTSPNGQVQRTPLGSQPVAQLTPATQASFLLPSATLVPQPVSQSTISNGILQSNKNSVLNLRSSSPIGTATIVGSPSQLSTATYLGGQHISIQPRPSLATFITGAPTALTLTVTSIAPSPTTLLTTSSSNSSQNPPINFNQQGQQFIRPVSGMSQTQALRAGIPVVLPHGSLPGRQNLSKNNLPRIAQKPLPHVSTLNSQPEGLGVSVKGNLPLTNVSLKDVAGLTVLGQSTTGNTDVTFTTTSDSTTTSAIVSTESVLASVIPENSVEENNGTPIVMVSAPVPSINDLDNLETLNQFKSSYTVEIETPTAAKENVPVQNNINQLLPPAEEFRVVVDQSSGPYETSSQLQGQDFLSSVNNNKELLSTANLNGEESKKSEEDISEKSSLDIKEDCVKIETIDADNQGAILTEGFIDSNLLEWTDGIGTLPGTDMKFKINEFGDLELVDDGTSVKFDSDSQSPAVEVHKKDNISEGVDIKVSSVTDPAELSEHEGDPICCCVYCGRYGYKSNFRTSGRFCSQSCAGKKNLHRKQMLMSKMMMGMKNKKKKLILSGEMKTVSKDSANEVSVPNNSEKKLQSFDWDQYLAETGAVGAPKRLFKDPFPSNRNGFRLGMRLEGVDPKHQSLYCVLSVAEVQGYRLRLHFDGFSECYDFWVNADSPFIFPVGWAEKNGKTLEPPKNVAIEEFNWTNYLKQIRAVAAPKSLFVNQPLSVTPSAFRAGMKLEAVDKKNSSLICVATVTDTIGDRILIHFDGWEDLYDYWCDITSPSIHPVGWCKSNGHSLSAPPEYGDKLDFDWETYLAETKSTAVPARAFKTRSPVGFEKGMKVEVVDKRNPILVRAATVADVQEHRVLIHFDGWDNIYDYWIDDDSTDLHPIYWCAKTFHPLQSPIDPKSLKNNIEAGGCPTAGCKGVGHIKGAKYTGHHSAFGCPYSEVNMSKDTALTDRLGSSRSEEGSNLLMRQDSATDIRKCPTPGCDGLGHVTGKFTSHHCLSGCPLAERNLIKIKQEPGVEPRPVGRPGRGRKRKIFTTTPPLPVEKKMIKTEPLDVCEEGSSLQASIHESVFQSSAMSLPSNDQPLCWEHHAKLLPGLLEVNQSQVSSWSVDQVADFVYKLTGKEDQAQKFKEEQVDGDSFLLLQQNDLLNFLNIKLGPAIKIFNSILVLKAASESLT
ncbi:lethal(3)malignant brain tumor-like protein 1 [Biomphalaria glabrata]|uniref:Lethal(3)malignant brain tumor-like protein 1 n=1 Tax=Biomphalaria glabrata TaxID=6526 RepID=A0A9W3ADH1_BIOGL|nr:lethal(3)malignant brain tumor-like protein 1 isoform X1 [Biomphalaria glabrata]XP_055885336.1 lethal(3)malignant brain tumor-like protein 1 isoform X1 [Biomphalaria glabrata]XP_055885337.1 lethal(3)malignant brain tumor-like protein 1 isoform X1 [Biomphalaria glabrata]XP_055885339.1 lethal(3)malignant brain tumor-like protein 1 isoform X1 [Biomphalaria glabrata]KAI8749658.1 lethal(3)malignant brain tumor-like protein 1 [Biomphalaria glabrata]